MVNYFFLWFSFRPERPKNRPAKEDISAETAENAFFAELPEHCTKISPRPQWTEKNHNLIFFLTHFIDFLYFWLSIMLKNTFYVGKTVPSDS